MDKTIFNFSIKKNLNFIMWFVLGIAITLVAYVILFPSISNGNSYADLLNSMPQDMLNAIGMTGNITNFNDYLNMNFYNSLYLYILMVFIIVFCVNLIAKPIDNTSLVYYLNSPVSRKKFLYSQVGVTIVAIVLLSIASILAGILSKIVIVNDTKFDLKIFITQNFVIGCIFIFLTSICVLINAISRKSNEAMAYCSTIVILEYIFDMVTKISDKVEPLKYFTVFTIYNTDNIYSGKSIVYMQSICLLIVSIIIIIFSAQIFKKRDLYL